MWLGVSKSGRVQGRWAACMPLQTMTSVDWAACTSRSAAGLVAALEGAAAGADHWLVLDPVLIPLVNWLVPFLVVKTAGRVATTTTVAEMPGYLDGAAAVASAVVVVDDGAEVVPLLARMATTPVTVVVRGLTRGYTYRLLEALGWQWGHDEVVAGVGALPPGNPFVRLVLWKVWPLPVEPNVLTLARDTLSVSAYLRNPLAEIDAVAEAVVDLAQVLPLRFANYYAKGDNASACVSSVHRLWAQQRTRLSEVEQYRRERGGIATDLVFVDRNVDFVATVLTQVSYGGLVREVLGKDTLGSVATTKVELDAPLLLADPLYALLGSLNFASASHRLRAAARALQLEVDSGQQAATIGEIKTFVALLGDLTARQKHLRTHTAVAEAIVHAFDESADTVAGGDPALEPLALTLVHDNILFLQGDLLEMDYRRGLAAVQAAIARNRLSLQDTLRCVCLLSLVHPRGIRAKDFAVLEAELVQNWSVHPVVFVLQRLKRHGVLVVLEDTGGVFGISGRLPAPEPDTASDTAAMLAGQGASAGVPVVAHGMVDFRAVATRLDLTPLLAAADGSVFNPEPVAALEEYPNPLFFYPGSYVPLAARLVELLYLRDFLTLPLNNTTRRPTWSGFGLETSVLGRQVDVAVESGDQYVFPKRGAPMPTVLREELVVVAVLGGITYSELAALRYVEQRLRRMFEPMGISKKVVVVTSSGFVQGSDVVG